MCSDLTPLPVSSRKIDLKAKFEMSVSSALMSYFSIAANLVHTGIVNLSNISSSSKAYQDDMEFGNKMAVLSGDFLLANACTGLAELRDTEVVKMISQVIGHLTEGEFLKITFNADNLNLEFWKDLVFKCKGSLMANSCKAALKIVAHPKEVRILR